MKRFIAILSLLAALIPAAWQLSAKPDASLLKVRDLKVGVDEKASSVTVDLTLDLHEINPGIDREVVFTPVMLSAEGTDSLELPQITVGGRNRYYWHLRNDDADDASRLYRGGSKELVSYVQTVDFEPWMGQSTVEMRLESATCCNTPDRIIGPTRAGNVELARIDTRRPDLLAEFVYTRPADAGPVIKQIEGKAFVSFVVNRTELKPDYMVNRREIAKILQSIDYVRNDSDATITHVHIKGFASPEGPYDNNVRLARGRTETLRRYVRDLYHFNDTTVTTSFDPEDWGGLRNYVRELRDFDIVPYAETPGSKTYHLHCRVAADQKWEPNFKFMVLANWPSYPVAGADPSGSDAPLSFTTGYDFSLPSNPLWTSVYTYNPEPLSDTNLIPLYGVKTCTEELVEGRYVSLGTLHLLRALAKVEVIFPADNNPYDFWEIETMELLRHNTAGFCAPTGVLSQDDYVKNSYNGDYVATPSIPEGYETGEPMPLVEVEKNRRWVLYLPEYRNVGRPDSEKARIHVAFRNTSVTREQFIDFKEYDNGGKPFDILRNNWYKFTLSKNSEFQNLTIEVDVRYYASVELRPGFGN